MRIQPAITPAKLKQVVKSAITDDTRPKNNMIFGLDEDKKFIEEAIDDAGCVTDLFYYIKQGDRMRNSVYKIARFGDKKQEPPGLSKYASRTSNQHN